MNHKRLITLLMDEEMIKKLDKESKQVDLNRSQLIRKAIRNHLKE